MDPLPPSSAYREAIAEFQKPKILLFYLFGIILGVDVYMVAFRKISLNTQTWSMFATCLSLGAVIGAYLRWRAHQDFERDVREMGWTIHHANLVKQRKGLFANS